jgi:hypothetical protein
VIRCSDWIVDLGLYGGDKCGGIVVALEKFYLRWKLSISKENARKRSFRYSILVAYNQIEL